MSENVDIHRAYVNEVKDSVKEFEENASKVNIVDTAKSRLLPLGEKIQNTYVKYYGDGSFQDALKKYYEITNTTPTPHVQEVGKVVNTALKTKDKSLRVSLLDLELKHISNKLTSPPKVDNKENKDSSNKTGDQVSQNIRNTIGIAGYAGTFATEKAVEGVKRIKEKKKIKEEKTPVELNVKRAEELGVINVPVEDSNILSSLSKIAEKDYISDMLPLYKKYVASVAVSDVLTKYGKTAVVDPQLTSDIVTVYKKHFGEASKEGVNTITSNFGTLLKKNSPEVYNQIHEEAQHTADQVKSSIIANVNIDESKIGVVVKEAQNSSNVIQAGAKANIMVNKTKQTAHIVARSSVVTSNVLSKGLADTVESDSAVGKQVGTNVERVKMSVIKAPATIDSTIKTVKGIKQTAATANRFVRSTVRVAQIAIKALVEASSALLATLGPVIFIILLIVVIIVSVIPGIMYGGLTHLSQDLVLNETYSYVTKFPADAISKYYNYIYEKDATVPDSLISDKDTQEAGDGYIYAGYNEEGMQYLKNTDPMAYISLLSSYYTEYSFPNFTWKNPSGADVTVSVTDGANLMSFKDFVAYSIVDVTGKKQEDNNFADAIHQISVVENKATLLKFLYADWWKPARDLKVQEEQLANAQTEAQIRSQVNIDASHAQAITSQYVQLLNNPTFLYYFGPSQKDNFVALVNKNKNDFDTAMNNTISIIDSYLKALSSAKSLAITVESYALGKYNISYTTVLEICGTDPSGNPVYCVCGYDAYGNPVYCTKEVCINCTFTTDTKTATSVVEAIFTPLENAAKQYKQDLQKYKKETDDLYDKLANEFMIMKMPPWYTGPSMLESTWYSQEELAREIGITASIESEYSLISQKLNSIKTDIDKASSSATKISQLNMPSPPDSCCNTCYTSFKSQMETVKSALSTASQTFDSLATQVDSVIKKINLLKKEVITSSANIDLHTQYTTLSESDLSDIESFTDRTMYMNAYNGNSLAVYIIKKVLSVDKAKTDKLIEDARSSFIQIYNPYGMLMKQDLNMQSIDWPNMTIPHHLGYFYDPIAVGKNPDREPQSFYGSVNGVSDFFTTTSTSYLVGGSPPITSGFLDTSSNWLDNTIVYKGNVITTNENLERAQSVALGVGGTVTYIPFDVNAPMSGKMKKTADGGIAISTVGEQEENGKIVSLNVAVILRGITLDNSIALDPTKASLIAPNGQGLDVGPDTKIGTANFLYISYITEEYGDYVIPGGKLFIPKEVNFYREPSIYINTGLY